MTQDEILTSVERLKPWFHCIELAPGIKTKTASIADEPADHPLGTWEIIQQCLPEDLSGKSVLDVGCNAGFYSVQAKRRNAARVLGVDVQRHEVRQAHFVRRALGLDIEFRRLSVYELSPRLIGQFDITLALGLIYHCKHLVLAFERLFQITRQMLILESAVIPLDKTPASFVHPLGGIDRPLHPLVYVENLPEASEPVFNWFLPSPHALVALAKNVGFHEATIFSARGERAVLVARKTEAFADSRVLGQLAASLELIDGETTCTHNAALTYRIRVQNTGQARWLASGTSGSDAGIVRLGAHLMKDEEEEVAWDAARADLQRELAPGEDDTLAIRLHAPAQPGRYYVEFDMVSEHLAWFEDLGSDILKLELDVQ